MAGLLEGVIDGTRVFGLAGWWFKGGGDPFFELPSYNRECTRSLQNSEVKRGLGSVVLP